MFNVLIKFIILFVNIEWGGGRGEEERMMIIMTMIMMIIVMDYFCS